MADVTLETIGELLRGMFEHLWNKPEGMPARDFLESLPDERTLRLATLPLVQAGWLVKTDKGRWYITPEGREACRRYPNAQELYREALQLLEQSKETAPLYALAVEEAQENAWGLIRRYLQESRRVQFQTMMADLLKAMGYHVAWLAPPEKDHGQIDILAHVDPIGARGPRILVQVKTKGQAVTLEGLKSFLSVLGPNDYGLYVSTGGFTADVLEQIRSNTFQKVTLLDLEGFFDLWLKHFDDLTQEARRRLPLKAVYFLYGLD